MMGKCEIVSVLALSCFIAVHHVIADINATAITSPPQEQICPQGETGPQGWPGEVGLLGRKGAKGDRGEPGFSNFRPPIGTPCNCPPGRKGEKGIEGVPGLKGKMGIAGYYGPPGEKGDNGPQGLPGPPGAPASRVSKQPPETPDTMYVPITITGKMPRVICHHLRRHAYVPVVPNKFVGWYEPGKSGYLTYNKWLYYSSRFMCPCSVKLPPGPTPSPEELLRGMEK
ncbi:collagen alpha-2(IX) chain-like [Dendronephthya gigantea]|uniref:collagen alpha-2(IX) chain-like n=1 Tax=Dendronephthya gigantea TaxID=151771 RepID=UPI00106B748C|nr:collagen alpha-2(IX) chain-like [Dendronephthya gigantea]